MNKKLDEASDPQQSLTYTSVLLFILLYPLVALLYDLKTLKDKERAYTWYTVDAGDVAGAWFMFLIRAGGYAMAAFVIYKLLQQLSLMIQMPPAIIILVLVLTLVLIVEIPNWIITMWLRKK